MEKMSMSIEVITPDVAREYLKCNTRNRAIRNTHVAGLIKAMRDGKWVLNGQPIIFDDEGTLIDGQHRLEACVLSGVAIMSYVVRGVSDARAFTTIDIGKQRGAHDMATYMSGISYTQAKDLVAAARIIKAWDDLPDKAKFEGCAFVGNPENEAIAAYAVSLCPLLPECCDHVKQRFAGMAPKSIMAACCYLFSRSSKEQAFEFFNMLHDGVFDSQNHPIKVLRDTLLMRDRSARKSVSKQKAEIMALIFKAWSYYRKGGEMKALRWRREGDHPERFPELA